MLRRMQYDSPSLIVGDLLQAPPRGPGGRKAVFPQHGQWGLAQKVLTHTSRDITTDRGLRSCATSASHLCEEEDGSYTMLRSAATQFLRRRHFKEASWSTRAVPRLWRRCTAYGASPPAAAVGN